MNRIALVEDHVRLADLIRQALQAAGIPTDVFHAMEPAWVAHRDVGYAALVIDRGLPDGDGVDFVRELRAWSGVPIIVLSARTHESEKVAALDAGADDYITKPFGVAELLARTRANLRRIRAGRSTPELTFRFGDVEVDLAARCVRKAGTEVHLTPIEYRLLALLVANAGRVLTHPHLLREVWGPGHSQSTPYLRVYMGNLRQKLEADSAQPKYILTETGVGYRLLAD